MSLAIPIYYYCYLILLKVSTDRKGIGPARLQRKSRLHLPWPVGKIAGQGMLTRVDLRVHTTAPSAKKDDERFIAQAEAYASFVATKRLTRLTHDGSPAVREDPPLLKQSDIIPTNMIPELQGTPEQHIDHLAEPAYDATTFLEETQLGYTALESQLFAPSSRVSTKVLKQNIHPPEHSTTEVSKSENQPSLLDKPQEYGSSSSHQVPSQSSYLKSPILDRSNKKPRINEENRRLFRTRSSFLPSSIPAREDSNHAAGSVTNADENKEASLPSQRHLANLVDNSVSVDDVTSELPTSYSLSDVTSVSSKGRQRSIQRSVSDPGPSPPEATESVPTRSRHVTQHSLDSPPGEMTRVPERAPRTKSSARSASQRPSDSDTVVKDFANVKSVQQPNDCNVHEPQSYSELPTSVRPPAPQPSLQPFKTHITESLRYLGDNTNLAQCYKPVSVSRDLRQSERGCWTFDITSWPAQLRLDFFQFLAKMIEPGRVGWGVWCTREHAALEVRVFCWGEVVRHVYLMLYVASKSKVRKLGLKWVDAEGEVVVQMRGADT